MAMKNMANRQMLLLDNTRFNMGIERRIDIAKEGICKDVVLGKKNLMV
jgi:hypothetical protein